MEQRDFYEAKSFLYEFYGVDMDDELFETIGLHAWDKINNKAYRWYKFRGEVKDHKIELPCNVDYIEYVQGPGESVGTTEPVTSTGAYNRSSLIEETIESQRRDTSVYYGRGHYVDYVQDGRHLIFKREHFPVEILYKGVVLDDNGLPKLNHKELEAVAKYCVYIDLQKKAMVTKDNSTMQLALMMKQEWLQAQSNARTPIYFSQNEMDQILDVQSSWDRKRYGISYKVLR